jgi:hypothetical protein
MGVCARVVAGTAVSTDSMAHAIPTRDRLRCDAHHPVP